MSDRKQIDRLFQEKLKNFEAIPDESAWENIHNRLHKDKRKRRVIPIWWKLAGVAALLALLFTVSNAIFTDASNHAPNTKVVDVKKTSEEKLNSNPKDTNNGNTERESNKSIITETDNTSDLVEETFEAPTLSSNPELTNQETESTKVATTRQHNNATLNSNTAVNTSQKHNNSGIYTKKDIVQNASNLPESDQNLLENQNTSKTESKAVINIAKKDDKLAVTDMPLVETLDVIAVQDSILKKEKSIEDAIAKADKTIEEEKEEKLNRWSVSPNAAPVYFNTLGKGSSIDAQFNDNPKNGDVNMSYGINGSYAVNSKLKIRAGVNKVNLGYSTDHIISYSNAQAFSTSTTNTTILRNVDFNASNQNMTFLSAETLNRNITPEIINTKAQGSIDQQFGFIEIPLELEYTLIRKKFGLNVIGGFSTFFVDKNEIYSVVDGNRTRIGEANNINDTSYSANFGLGFNYHFSDKLKLNLEPMFKYQINTFTNTSGDFQPYFIGVYTGFSFKF